MTLLKPRHHTLRKTYAARAQAASHPLTSYLLRLMDLKTSNLCLSADVYTARELLNLADKVGPSIVVLKTHYDLVSEWDYNPHTGTGARLAALAAKHGFLIFEDRKFVDIGKTVQRQYTAGTARIIEWAHIINCAMFAGPDMVRAMAEAAAHWRERIKCDVFTTVTADAPMPDCDLDNGDDDDLAPDKLAPEPDPLTLPEAQTQQRQPSPNNHQPSSVTRGRALRFERDDGSGPTEAERKRSIVSITTLTQSFEPASSPRLPKRPIDGSSAVDNRTEALYPGIEEAPLERGLLILAQMSTRGCLMRPEYAQACVETARAYKSFVMGFVSQQNLNSDPYNNFIHMTPGCKLPAVGEAADSKPAGDALGQQYNTPSQLVTVGGTDIVIVGRGITEAADPALEAERYRRHAWKAYLARVSWEEEKL